MCCLWQRAQEMKGSTNCELGSGYSGLSSDVKGVEASAGADGIRDAERLLVE